VSPGKGGIMNSMNYENATVDNTYYEQAGIMDQSRRQALLTRIQDALMADLPAVPLVENKTFWATSDKVQGNTWHPDNALHWYDFRPAN
jgi:ABC-type transport system substrate-binding protein